MRILFVCMGNICRSPTAEGVMRRLLRDAGLEGVEVESAGTGGWHAGEPPDERAAAAAAAPRRDAGGRGAPGAAARTSAASTCSSPWIAATCASCSRSRPTTRPRGKVRLLVPDADVPDPYYGGDRGFETVLDMVERACRGLIDDLRAADRV